MKQEDIRFKNSQLYRNPKSLTRPNSAITNKNNMFDESFEISNASIKSKKDKTVKFDDESKPKSISGPVIE